jgi:hypothetical protein
MAVAGATLLEKLHDELQQQGIQLGLCNPGEVTPLVKLQPPVLPSVLLLLFAGLCVAASIAALPQ